MITPLAPPADFPVLAREIDGNPVVYLDSAATSLTPRPVIEAMTHYYASVSANVHRGKHILSEEASEEFEAARHRVAEFVGAQSDQVVFTAGATHSLNLVVAGIELTPDDTALVSADAHHSLQLPLRERTRVEWIPYDARGVPDLDRYSECLLLQPRLVAITECSNVTGQYAPVAEMAKLAQDAGALVIVDGAQSVPHRPMQMLQLGVDALAFSAHKMLGPTGLGVLVLGPHLIERLRPGMVGGGTVDWVDYNQYRWRRAPHRFEAGTPHIAGAYGMRAAVEYLSRLTGPVGSADTGMAAVAEHDRSLAALLRAEAAQRDYLDVLGEGLATGILSVRVRGVSDLAELVRALSDSYGIMCRSGHLCVQPFVDRYGGGQLLRISTYVYNSSQDVQAAFAALDELHAALSL